MPHLKYSFLSLHCNVFEAASLNPLPSSRDAAAFFATLRRRKEKSQSYGELASPTLDKATKWLEGRAKYLASDSEKDAVLVLYVSTHGFESNGDLHLCLRDSSQATQSMLSLSTLEKLLVPFWEEYPTRRIVLLLQTCRERLVPKQAKEKTLEELWAEKQQWSVFFAAQSGGQARGTEKSFSLRDEDFGVAYGLFTKVFLEKWREKELPSNLGDLSDEVRRTLQELRENAVFVGRKDLIWPPLKKKSPPPPEFRDKRFQSLEKGETLLGRERVLFAALGRWLDKDTDRKGWLETSKDVVCLHGPSGGGKSSLVKAGLLPHLQGAVYADLSKEPFPEAKEKNIIFLDQIEGFLNETRFEKLIGFLKKAKEKACKTVLVVRSDAEPEFQRLWYAYAPNEWDIDYRVVEVLTETEAEDVIDGSLPARIAQELPNGWKNQLFRTISQVGRGGSPALLQLVLWDLNHTKKLRPLEEIWEEIWKTTVKGSLEREMIAVVSAFCPLEEGALWQKRRVWHEEELVTWLSFRDFRREDLDHALKRLLEAHWLTRGQEDGQSALVLTHDLLLPFLAEQIRDDRQERKQRSFARRLYTTLLGAHLDSKQASLAAHLKEEFAPHELAVLSRHTQFWWQWVKKEALDSSTDIPSQIAFEGALENLLVVQRRKYRQILRASVTVGFLLLLFGMGWYWKTSVEHRLLSEMEVCTEAPEATLPFHKFQVCTKALAKAEQWKWAGATLFHKKIKLLEAFQAKGVPAKWWSIIPFSLDSIKNIFTSYPSPPHNTRNKLTFCYFLRISLKRGTSISLSTAERNSLLLLFNNFRTHHLIISVWTEWVIRGGKPTLEERVAWRRIMETNSDPKVGVAVINLWNAWFFHGGRPTPEERSAWLRMIRKISGSYLTGIGVWKAWLTNGGKPTLEERSAWLGILENSAVSMVWEAWLANGGKPTLTERLAWLKALKSSASMWGAWEVWEMWAKKGGKPTEKERTAWLEALGDIDHTVRSKALKVWKAWLANGGKPTLTERSVWLMRGVSKATWNAWLAGGGKITQEERTTWLSLLQSGNEEIQNTVLILSGAWVANGEKPTKTERVAWLQTLKSRSHSVRISSLKAWEAYLIKGGESTQEEQNAWLESLKSSNLMEHEIALRIWKIWAEKRGKPTREERKVWLNLITDQEYGVRNSALVVWNVWFTRGLKPTQEERTTWLSFLKNGNEGARSTVLLLSSAWVANGGKPTKTERLAWLVSLGDRNTDIQQSSIRVWFVWVANGGKPTKTEKLAWFRLLKMSNRWWVRKSVYVLLKKWLEKGEKPTKTEKINWPELLKHQENHKDLFELWNLWFSKGGKLTKKERLIWLKKLNKTETCWITMQILGIWIKNGGKPTKIEKIAWLEALKSPSPQVRTSSLGVWKIWASKGGRPTRQELSAWLETLEDVAKSKRASKVKKEMPFLSPLVGVDENLHEAALSLWEAWGRTAALQKKHSVRLLKEWLEQTKVWEEAKAGIEVLQKQPHLKPTVVEMLFRYPLFRELNFLYPRKEMKKYSKFIVTFPTFLRDHQNISLPTLPHYYKPKALPN